MSVVGKDQPPLRPLINGNPPCYDLAMSPYDAPDREGTQEQQYHPCEHCGIDDEPTHPVQTGGGILTLCALCRSEVVGGS
ncbi:MAG TPA: hypothetical protein VLY45_02745 [Nitrospiria bacterium]|nr:hypothetical protein [Nitrospiria bacterium]